MKKIWIAGHNGMVGSTLQKIFFPMTRFRLTPLPSLEPDAPRDDPKIDNKFLNLRVN